MNGCIEDATVFVAYSEDTEISTCAGDDVSDRVRFATSTLSMAFGYVVVDQNDIIVHIGYSNFINFDMLPQGVLRVYAFSMLGFITADEGQDFNTAVLSTPCFGLTTNYVTVNNGTEGSFDITTTDGQTEVSVCSSDGQPDLISFTADSGLSNTAYVVTDENLEVLDVNTTGSIDFEGAGSGNYLVWAVGYETAIPYEVGDLLTPGNGCNATSNEAVTIVRQSLSAGSPVTSDGDTEITTCPGDGSADEVNFVIDGGEATQQLIVTSEEGNILSVPDGNTIDFEGAEPGTCRVWVLAYEGELLAQVDDNIYTDSLAEGCYGLSADYVTVNRIDVQGGSITFSDGSTTAATCSGDGQADLLSFEATGQVGSQTVFVITNEDNVVLDITDQPEADFEGADGGTCRVWVLTYEGDLLLAEDDDVDDTLPASSCFALSDNFLEIVRTPIGGGTVSLSDGSTETTICSGDGQPDLLSFTVDGHTGSQVVLVVTDTNNMVLNVTAANQIDFEGAEEGICRVWALAYENELLVEDGDTLETTELAAGCYDLSDDFVSINRQSVEVGSPTTAEGDTSIIVCPGDGQTDEIQFAIDGGEAQQVLVVTDEAGNILGLPPGLTVDFEGAEPGTCRVYVLAYEGELLATTDENIYDIVLASGCYQLSDDYVTVERYQVEGGTISLADGGDQITICPGDGLADEVQFALDGQQASNVLLVITNEENNILNVTSDTQIDFDEAEPGTCRVWVLAYEGELLADIDGNVDTSLLADGCYDLSDNFVTVIRQAPQGGTISESGGQDTVYVCSGDGNPDEFTFTLNDADGPQTGLIITDEDGMVIGTPNGSTIDFDGAEPGICRVYGISYEGELLAVMGDHINEDTLAEGCYALTDNYITLVRDRPDGGTVSTEDGQNEVVICPNNGTPDVIRFDSTGSEGLENFTYLITDTANVVSFFVFGESFNFDGADIGVCRVWGLSYNGDLNAVINQDLDEAVLANDCYALSENYISVRKEITEGGTVSTEDGATEVFICPGDGVDDFITFDRQGAAGGELIYIITDESDTILTMDVLPTFNFENAGIGNCRLWSLTYQGDLLATVDQHLTTTQLSDGCFELSQNFVNVIRNDVQGGMVSLASGGAEIATCPGDGLSDSLSFVNTGALGPNYVYVITDTANVIMEVVDGNTADFEDGGLGICRVWGLSYAGDLLAMPGDTANLADLATGCYALSDNFVTVNRVTPEAGNLVATGGDTLRVCAGDDIPDVIEFMPSGQVGSYALLGVRDGLIVGLLSDFNFDFDNAAAGVYEIYGLAYTGLLNVMPGDSLTGELATSCFELTEDFVRVEVTVVNGGTISADGNEDFIYLCPTNVAANMVDFETNTTAGGSYRYVITTETGIILSPLEDGVSSFDFNSFPIQVVRVYGVNYTGNFTGSLSNNIEEIALSDGCYDLSENYLTVVQDAPEAGTIAIEDELFCAVNGNSDLVVTTTSSSLAGYAIIVTDTNDVVQLVATDPSAVDLSDLAEGNYRIYGLSYTGNLTVEPGDLLDLIALADNCYERTDDFLDLERGATLEGGVLQTIDGLDTVRVCPQDGQFDIVAVESTVSGVPYLYAVTDDEGNILIPQAASSIFNFDNNDPGISRIYGYAYTGNPIAFFGQNIEEVRLSSECYALSENYITVIRDIPDGGTVATIEGDTSVTINIDSNDTTVEVMNSNMAPLALYTYLITDEDNVIIGSGDGPVLDFGDAEPGVCRIWGLSYQGDLTFSEGDTATVVELASACFSLSTNFIEVVRVAGRTESFTPAEVQEEYQQPTVDLRVFPNPSQGDRVHLQLKSAQPLPAGIAVVRDQHGRAWATQAVNGGRHSEQITLDVAQLPSGLFVVQYRSEGRMHAVRFLRQ